MRSDFDSLGQGGTFIANARRQQIKAAAVDVILEVGYAKTSLARIAQRAGISKGVISYHFAGRDELMEKLVIEFYTAGAEYIIPRLQEQSTARGMLRAYIEANIEYIAANRQGIIAITDIVLNHRGPDGRLRFGHEGGRELIEGVAEILRRGQNNGEFGEFDPWVVASTLRQSMDMVSAELSVDPDIDTAHYAAELVALFDRATRKE